MIKWQEKEPDVKLSDISEYLRELSWIGAIRVLLNALFTPTVFMTEECKRSILAHLQTSHKELGGLLVGRAFSISLKVNHGYPLVSVITNAIPSQEFKNSACSLRMEPEIWNAANQYLGGGNIVIGWYHSHPNIGAFFSGTDRMTQKAFFSNPYSLGLVVDPCQGEWKCFFGPRSIELQNGPIEIH